LIDGEMSLFHAKQSPQLLPGAGLRVEREEPGAAHEVWLSGRIDIDSAPDLRKVLLHRLRLPACRTLTVNSEQIAYIDSAGIATLLEVLKAARQLRKQFGLNGLRDRPRYLFEVTRLLHLFDGGGDSVTGTRPVTGRTS
jgi:anti-sigma B factor antagonist